MRRAKQRSNHWAIVALYVSALAVLLAAAQEGLAASAASKEEKARPATVKVTFIEGTQSFPLLVMQTKGIADKYNLKLEENKVAGPQGLATAMQTGNFEVSFRGWLSTALMRSKGHKAIVVYSLTSYTDDLVARVNSPFKSIADLKGRRIGISGGPATESVWLFRLEAVRFFGFDPLKEAKVQFGAPPLLMGLLENNELDAILVQNPQVVQLVETGQYRSIASLGGIWREKTGQDPLFVSVTMNETWAKANPDVARRFVAAYKEALEYLKTHPDVWPALAKSLGIKTDEGARLLQQRTAGGLLTRWDKKFIDEQYRYAAEVIKVFAEAEEFPKQIPEGTFDMSYAP
ncbi:MAG TPA: ABC transporter substrate-binding protein [Candidatus Binatia bacterium]